MTDRTLQLYNSNRVYYALERDIAGTAESSDSVGDSNGDLMANTEILDIKGKIPSATARIDNPDQRITEDVRLC